MESKYYEHVEKFKIMKSKGINYYSHFHEQVEVVYCLQETIHATIDGKDYEIRSGDLVMVFPNQPHSYVNTKMEEPKKAIVLVFYPKDIEDYYYELTSMVPETPVIRKEELPAAMRELMIQFAEVCQEPVDIRRLRAYTTVVIGHLLDSARLHCLKEERDVDASQRILSYINENYKKQLTITEVSKALGVSTTVISSMFSQKMNTSFVMYINSLRVRWAKKLLRSTDSGMKEIAVSSGFKSQRSFYRLFQDSCGMTPGEYRRKDREEKRRKYGADWTLKNSLNFKNTLFYKE